MTKSELRKISAPVTYDELYNMVDLIDTAKQYLNLHLQLINSPKFGDFIKSDNDDFINAIIGAYLTLNQLLILLDHIKAEILLLKNNSKV